MGKGHHPVLLVKPPAGSRGPVYLAGLRQIRGGPDERPCTVPPAPESLQGTLPYRPDGPDCVEPDFPIWPDHAAWGEIGHLLCLRVRKAG
jgi:hypothetical protein